MSDYFDCLVWKEAKSGKKYARQIGSAKKRDDGGFNVYLDATPIDGKFTISPQRDRQQSAPSQQSHGPQAYGRNDMEDEIPF